MLPNTIRIDVINFLAAFPQMVCPDPLTSVLDLRQCKEMADTSHLSTCVIIFIFIYMLDGFGR